MKITDEMLTHAAPHACTLWLETTSAEIPRQAASLRFERKMARLLRHPRRPIGWHGPVAAVAAAALLTMTVGAEMLSPVRAFRSGVVHVLSQVFPKSTDQIYTTDADHEGETKQPVLEGITAPVKTIQEKTIVVSLENPSFTSVEEMAAAADLIVSGRYTARLGTYNVTRDENDPISESSSIYSEGRKYTFAVEEVLGGTLSENTITIGKKVSDGVTLDSVVLQIPSVFFTEPALHDTRVLFLDYDPSTGFYYSIGEPWEIAVADDGALSRCLETPASTATAETETDEIIYRLNIRFSGISGTDDFISSLTYEQLKAELKK